MIHNAGVLDAATVVQIVKMTALVIQKLAYVCVKMGILALFANSNVLKDGMVAIAHSFAIATPTVTATLSNAIMSLELAIAHLV